MFLSIQEFNNYKNENGILPLPLGVQELLNSLEKSLNVESIELAISQYQELKTSQNTNKYRNISSPLSRQSIKSETTGKWCKTDSISYNHKNIYPTSSFGTSNNDDKWVKYVETIGEFKPTIINDKEGIEKTINEIRTNLNKITKKNFETQKNKIFMLIDSIKINNIDDDPIKTTYIYEDKIAHFIFDISSSNKFFCELYADLYKELIQKHKDIYLNILNEFIFTFKKSIESYSYCEPENNYDKYCAFVKESDRKKAVTTFIIMLLNRDIVSKEVVIEITEYFLTIIHKYIDEENRICEIEELGEILYILVSQGNEKLQWDNSEKWNSIIHNICKFTTLKVKQHKSLSSRFIFKMKDLYDLL